MHFLLLPLFFNFCLLHFLISRLQHQNRQKKWRRRSCLLRVEGQNSTRQRLSQLSSQLIVYVQSESSSSDALKCANFQSDVSLSHPAFIIPFLSHHPSKGCRVFFFLVKFAAFAMSSDFTSLLCLISLQFLCWVEKSPTSITVLHFHASPKGLNLHPIAAKWKM